MRFGCRLRECVLSFAVLGACAAVVLAMYVVFLVAIGFSLVQLGFVF